MKNKIQAAFLAGLLITGLAGCASTPPMEPEGSSGSAITADAASDAQTSDGKPAESAPQTDAQKTDTQSETPEAQQTAEEKKTEPPKTEAAGQSAPLENTAASREPERPSASRTEPAQTPPAATEPPNQEAASEPPQQTEVPTLPWITQPPKSFTQADHERIVSEVTAYAESYQEKGFQFIWDDSLVFGWETGYMGTPRVKYEGVDGVITMLKYHVDKIVKVATDPSNGVPSSIANYKVMQVTVDGDIAFVVLYG